jgi:hypothetical protein
MASDPKTIVTEESMKRFETIFAAINERLEKHMARAANPFE